LSGLARQAGRLHPGGLLLVALLVIAAHLLLLGSVDGFALAMSMKNESPPPRSVQVVSMTEAAPVVPETVPPPVAAPAPAPKAAPAPRRPRPKPVVPKASHEPAAATAETEAPASPPEPAVAVAEASPATEPAASAELEASAPAASEPTPTPDVPPPSEAVASSAGAPASAPAAAAPASAEAPASAASAATPPPSPPPAEPMPVYPTSLPPAFSFAYDLSRNPLRGNGNLVFTLTDAGYEARLEGSVAGFSVLEWISRGAFDEAGFAPLRFTEQRLRRAPTAANFQREAGKITYSANSDERPLPPGAQDRLSWMLQLAAIAHARPELAPGQRITMFVTGVRADAEPWSFSVVGPETVRIPLGSIDTIHLLREPRFAHDTRADVWLDPSRHHLPVRARLSNSEDGSDAFELQLRQAPASLP